MISATSLAQIRIIPKEKRDSVTNPATLKCNDMYFAAGRSLDFGTMDEPDPAIGTGSVLQDQDGLYHLFYTGHNDTGNNG